MRTITHHI
jgi:protein transport protein SEC23